MPGECKTPWSSVSGLGSPGVAAAVAEKRKYRLVVMGAARVGKSALIQQFLFDRFITRYKETVEETYSAEYELYRGVTLVLDILDTSGAHSFPAMRRLEIGRADGFVLVYAGDDPRSFAEVKRLRDQILAEKALQPYLAAYTPPIVVAGNKSDLDAGGRAVDRAVAEMTVCLEWGHGFVHCSAKRNHNVDKIFKELLTQAHLMAKASAPFVRQRCYSAPTRDTRFDGSADHKPNKLKRHKSTSSCVIS